MTLALTIDFVVVVWLTITAIRRGFDSVLPIAAGLLMVFPTGAEVRLPGLFDLTVQRVITLALIGLYLAIGRSEHTQEEPQGLPLRWLLGGVIGWMVISSVMSVVPSVSFKSCLSQCLDFAIPYVIYARCMRNREQVESILGGFVSGMSVCAIFGLLEIYKDWTLSSLFPTVAGRFSYLESADLGRGMRVHSSFDHPILFGAALALAIPMTLYLLTQASSVARKAYLWCALFMMTLCIYKTGSRGPWLAVLFSVVVLVTVGDGQIRRTAGIIVALGALALVTRPGIRASVQDLYGSTMDPDSAQGESYQWRYVLYHVARQELSKDLGRSLWGFGPESFYYLGLTTDVEVDGVEHTVQVQSCDSAVVELTMDTGYVGFLLVALLLLKAAYVSLHSQFVLAWRKNSLSLLLFVNICAFCFLMTNVELFGWGQQSYMLWIVISLAMVMPRVLSESHAEERGITQIPRPTTTALQASV